MLKLTFYFKIKLIVNILKSKIKEKRDKIKTGIRKLFILIRLLIYTTQVALNTITLTHIYTTQSLNFVSNCKNSMENLH